MLTLCRLYAPILDLHLSTKHVRSVAGPLRALPPCLQAEFVRVSKLLKRLVLFPGSGWVKNVLPRLHKVLTFEFERHWEPVGDYTAPEIDPLLDLLEHLDVATLTHFKFLCYPFQGGILALRIKAFHSLRYSPFLPNCSSSVNTR
jgi:hypothetical protein